MKQKLFLINLALGVGLVALGYFTQPGYLSGVAGGIGVSFIAIAAGIVVVHFYLDRASRQAATISIFSMVHNTLVDFHETYLEIMWSEFSSEYFRDICALYNQRECEISVIKPEDREKMLKKLVEHKEKILIKADALEETLREMTNLIGWDLDPHLLASTLQARTHLRSCLAFDWDKVESEDEERDYLVQHMLELDDHIEMVLGMLISLCQFPESPNS